MFARHPSLLALLAASIWATSGIFIRYTDLPPASMAFFGVVILHERVCNPAFDRGRLRISDWNRRLHALLCGASSATGRGSFQLELLRGAGCIVLGWLVLGVSISWNTLADGFLIAASIIAAPLRAMR